MSFPQQFLWVLLKDSVWILIDFEVLVIEYGSISRIMY